MCHLFFDQSQAKQHEYEKGAKGPRIYWQKQQTLSVSAKKGWKYRAHPGVIFPSLSVVRQKQDVSGFLSSVKGVWMTEYSGTAMSN